MKVELRNVSFGYDMSTPVLKDITFDIASAECVAIVGSSGSGKSTLLRVLCGLLPSSKNHQFSGQVLIDDIDITREKQTWQQMRERGVLGFMFQEPSLLPNLEVDQNIHLPLRILDNVVDGEAVVGEYLRLTGLDADKDKLPEQLSGGMKTRAALARTFITRPRLLLLDEPFSDLDIVWKARLYAEVKKLRSQLNSTVIIVTHDIFEAIFFSRAIMVLGSHNTIVERVTIDPWSDSLDYNDVILRHHQDFVDIKNLIESG